MAGLITMAKSFGNPKKGRKKKKRDGKKKAAPEYSYDIVRQMP